MSPDARSVLASRLAAALGNALDYATYHRGRAVAGLEDEKEAIVHEHRVKALRAEIDALQAEAPKSA